MKMKSYNLPAVLLAVITAIVLMLAVGMTETAYADDGGYSVEVKTMFGEDYIGLPGTNVPLQAQVYYDFDGESYIDDGDLELRWELDEDDSQFAKLKVHKYSNRIATVQFKDLPEGETDLDAIVTVKVSVISEGKEVASDYVFLIDTTDYYSVDKTPLDAYLAVGDPTDIEVSVRHYTMAHKEGEIVKNVDFSWDVDGGAFSGLDAPVEKTDEKAVYKITRLTPEESILVIEAKWVEGEDTYEEYGVVWTENIPTDLNDYKVSLPGDINNWEYFVDEGEVIDRQYLEDNTSVYYEKKDDVAYLKNGVDYDLVVEKYLGYDEETGLPIFEEYKGDLKTAPQGSDPDLNGEPTEGTGVYKVTAKAKGDMLSGVTEDYAQWIFMYSKSSISAYAPMFEFDYSYGSYLDEEPWFRYDVKPGTVLDPMVTLNEVELEEGTDFVTRYVCLTDDADTETILDEFPTEPGEYVAYVEGIGSYYGTSYQRYIKVGKTNYDFKASGKTIKAKAKKKTTFTAKKAFTVSGNKGEVKYEKVSGNSKITVSSAGKVTVKKGLKKGKTYKVKVKITDGDSAFYFAASKTVTLKVKVTK